MIDGEVFLYTLLRRDIDDSVQVAADVDVGAMGELPYVTFTITDNGETANGDGLWGFLLTVGVFHEGMDAAKELAQTVHDIMAGWDEDPGRTYLVDIGSMPSIDVGVFTRNAASEIGGRNVVQYVSASALALRTIQ